MLNRKSTAAIGLLVMLGACATQPKEAAPIASASALCLIDTLIFGEVPPAEDFNDVGNVYDSDPTIEKIELHNERLRAACPAL